MDDKFETKFRIIKKLIILTGEQAKNLADKNGKLNEILNLYHSLAVEYNLLTTHYFNKESSDNDIFQKIKITLSKINPDYMIYLEKI